ncbi:hypothetical protein I4U23_016455 [Adineta vaga]|nr:hypothetical protein I4U23_016455 [Adineta vaga]
MAALPFLLGGIAALGGGAKLLWDKNYPKAPISTIYDVVIRMSSLLALKTTGWEIVLGEKMQDVHLTEHEFSNDRGVIVSVMEKEVVHLFDAIPKETGSRIGDRWLNVPFYRSVQNGINLRHFVLAKKDSRAAQEWNDKSIDDIMNILQASTNERRNLNVIAKVITYVNTKLPHLFRGEQGADGNVIDADTTSLKFEMHKSKPSLFVSQRAGLDDLNDDPFPIDLSPKLVYDDAGYFVGITSTDRGEWQPRCNIYETTDDIHVIVELTGFKESFENPVARQEQIPIGIFKLEIPLGYRVKHTDAKLHRDQGFYRITCNKVKNTSTRLK